MDKHNSTNSQERSSSEENLPCSNDLYSTFKNMVEACVVLSNDRHCTYVNKKAAEFFNQAPNELIGKRAWTLFPAASKADFYHKCISASEQQQVFEGEEYFFGLEKWISYRLYPSEDALLVFFSERTDKKCLEQTVSRSEVELENFKEALDASSIVSITDQDEKIIYANRHFCEISQYSPEELIGKSHLLIESPYHSPSFYHEVRSTISQGKVWKGEFCNSAKDGSLFWLDTTIVPFLDKQGHVKQYLSIQHDISERKKAALALRENEQLYRFLFENNSDALFLICLDGNILQANNVALNFLELSLSSAQNLNLFSFLNEEAKNQLHDALHDPAKKNWRSESIINYKSKQAHVVITLIPLNYEVKRNQFFIRVKDITARKNQEKEQELLHELMYNLSTAQSLQEGMSRVTRLLCHFTGFPYAEYWMPIFGQNQTRLKSFWSRNENYFPLLAHSTDMLVGPNHQLGDYLRKDRIFHCPNLKEDIILRRKLAAIQCGYRSYVAIPLYYRENYLGSFLLFSTEETSELSFDPGRIKEILINLGGEIERRQSNEELNRFFSLSPDLLGIIGFDGFIKKLNPSFQKLSGYNDQELLSQFFIDLVHADDQQRLYRGWEEAIKGKSFSNYEFRIACKDGGYRWLECNNHSIVEDGLTYVVARDITQHKMQNEQIQKLSKAVEESGNEIYITDAKSQKFTYANKQALSNLGYSLEEFINIGPDKVRANSNNGEIKSIMDSLLNGKCNSLRYNSLHIRKDGSQYPVEVHLSLFEHITERSFVAHVVDISDRLKVEEDLRISNERYQLVKKATHDAIWDWDIRKDNIYWGKGFFSLFGYDLHNSSVGIEELISLVHKEDAKKVIEGLFDTINAPKIQWEAEYRHKCQDGTYKYVKNRAYLIYDAAGKAIRMTGAITDITDIKKNEELLKQFNAELETKVSVKTIELEVALAKMKQEILSRIKAERILQDSIQEKDVLIKEIHHRVKNNMAIVSSLLFLQARLTKIPEVKSLVKESQARIKSMALIHELLYQNENLSKINFQTYIHELVNEILTSFQSTGLLVEISIEVENIELDIVHALPCSLILNELITNSFKYAFPDRQKGRINIFFKEWEGLLILKIADNGIGLPQNFNIKKSHSLGMQLVFNLVRQLGGDLTYRNNNGAEFEISFSPIT